MIKAKYNEVIESITLDSSFRTAIGITPDGPAVFSGSPKFIHNSLNLTRL